MIIFHLLALRAARTSESMSESFDFPMFGLAARRVGLRHPGPAGLMPAARGVATAADLKKVIITGGSGERQTRRQPLGTTCVLEPLTFVPALFDWRRTAY